MPDAPPADAIYFLSLELENVRCFGEKQVLDLRDPKDPSRPAMWTVILGENGTGKTTLLQMLAMWAVNKGPPKAGAFIPGLLAQHTDNIGRRGADLTARVVARTFGRFDNRYTETGWFGITQSNTEATHTSPGGDLRTLQRVHGYGASRTHAPHTRDMERAWAEVATLFRPDATLMSPEEWLLRLDYRAADAGRKGAAQAALDRLKAMLVELLPDVTAVYLSPPEARGLAASAGKVTFDTPYGRVALRDLSLGYQTLIAWTVDLAFRLAVASPDAENPLETPCVVLVDEIDLHLHPAWQRTLHRQLRAWFPNAQFIVTAHSPLVVQSALDENLAVLRREGDHVVIDNDPQVVQGWRVDQLLTSDLFGLKGSRSEQVEQTLERRRELVAKEDLTPDEAEELKRLDAEADALPTASGADQAAMDLIRQAAALLKARSAP